MAREEKNSAKKPLTKRSSAVKNEGTARTTDRQGYAITERSKKKESEEKPVAAREEKTKSLGIKKPHLTLKKSVTKLPEAKDETVDKRDGARTVEIKNISNERVEIVKKSSNKKDLDIKGRAYATGKRKSAIAKVWLKKGKGDITINGKPANEYLKRAILDVIINIPFDVTNTKNVYDVACNVIGGGLSGQAGAIKHGISKALLVFNSEAYRKDLKHAGLLTRDARVVERKKAGLKKARKGQVFSKR
jgi:small subunit ribosomal protein S9